LTINELLNLIIELIIELNITIKFNNSNNLLLFAIDFHIHIE